MKMKKQDNESLIHELTKRLDWYMMEASDEEFDADEVQALMKWLDSLKSEEDKAEEEVPVEEALEDFWKYCEEREEDERVLFGDEKSEDGDSTDTLPEDGKKSREGKLHKVLWFFHRRRVAVVTVAVLVVMIMGGSWQVVANAEKHGGFFWWMDKSEEGTTMITSPESGVQDRNNDTKYYYKIEEVPDEYQKYANVTLKLSALQGYELNMIKIVQRESAVAMYVFLEKNNESNIQFEIKIYPQNILRIRNGYPGYIFAEEFEHDGLKYEVFEKNELDGVEKYVVYFYCGNVKYVIVDMEDKDFIKEVSMECGEAVTEIVNGR